MPKVYGVLGSGAAPERVVKDGLADINGDDVVFLIHARRKPQGAVTAVYDFLADNECEFYAYHRVDDNAPKALLELAEVETTTDDPAQSMLEYLRLHSGTLLLLWDEANPEASETFAIKAANMEIPIKDLSDGLAPVVVEGKPVSEPVKEETPFSRDELMNMNIGVLRRQAKAMGIEEVGRTKQEIVDALLGASGPEVASDAHAPVTAPTIDHGNMAIVVWHENGLLTSVQLPVEAIKALLR